MATTVIDTNLLVRIATGDIPAQAKKAVAHIQTYQRHQVMLPESVVAEVVFVLSSKKHYNFPRSAITSALRELLAIEQLSCDRPLLERAADYYQATTLDFVDCIILANVKLERVENLLSFDAPLSKANK